MEVFIRSKNSGCGGDGPFRPLVSSPLEKAWFDSCSFFSRSIMRALAATKWILVTFVIVNLALISVFTISKWDIIHLKPDTSYGIREPGDISANISRLIQNNTSPSVGEASRTATTKIDVQSAQYKPTVRYADPVCPKEGLKLVGKLDTNHTAAERSYWNELNLSVPYGETEEMKSLGPSISWIDFNKNDTFFAPQTSLMDLKKNDLFFAPEDCRPTYSVAIIIPFRDRESHLRILLGLLVPVLQRQLVRYTIFVAEQNGNETFNKGRLMNTAFEFASKLGKSFNSTYDCFIFHDVDMLTEYDTLLYRCSKGRTVNHLSTTLDIFGYRRLCCGMTIGGVLAFKEENFRLVNGFPTEYWGWGAEDDDMNKRVHEKKLMIARPLPPKGSFSMIRHQRDKNNPLNINKDALLLQWKARMNMEGLNNLLTKITKIEKYTLFIKLSIDVGKPS